MNGPFSGQTRWLVLLRGVNVGGRHPVAMAALRELFERELGCTEVATYIQSGNLVCYGPSAMAPEQVAAAIERHFGFAVPVAMRGREELRAMATANPFAADPADQLHVVFLAAPLADAVLEKLKSRRAGEEQIAAIGRELFLQLPHGFGRSKLALGCTAPGVPGDPTVRNWKTVLQLLRMLG